MIALSASSDIASPRRLGEASGAALAIGLVKAAVACHNGMATFAEAGVSVLGLDAIDAKLHNPTAEVSYDVLAMKGGARLYSRLSPLFEFVKNGDGAPTQGMRDVFAACKQELDTLEAALGALLQTDLAALNTKAAAGGYPGVWVAD